MTYAEQLVDKTKRMILKRQPVSRGEILSRFGGLEIDLIEHVINSLLRSGVFVEVDGLLQEKEKKSD